MDNSQREKQLKTKKMLLVGELGALRARVKRGEKMATLSGGIAYLEQTIEEIDNELDLINGVTIGAPKGRRGSIPARPLRKTSVWDPQGTVMQLPAGDAAEAYKKRMIRAYEEQNAEAERVRRRNTIGSPTPSAGLNGTGTGVANASNGGTVTVVDDKTNSDAAVPVTNVAEGDEVNGKRDSTKSDSLAESSSATSAYRRANRPRSMTISALLVGGDIKKIAPPTFLITKGLEPIAEEATESESAETKVAPSRVKPKEEASSAVLSRSPETDSLVKALAASSKNWIISKDEVSLDRMIGEGCFGEVWIGQLWGKEVAIKRVKEETMDAASLADFTHEVEVMAALRHPNILLLIGVVANDNELLLVTELCERGSLYDVLVKREPMDMALRLRIAHDAALGMRYLHRQRFVHCDLKSKNLLVTQEWLTKVCDFGLSMLRTDQRVRLAGTKGYLSPELYSILADPYDGAAEMVYTDAADVYSFGVILWELYTGIDAEDEANRLWDYTMKEIEDMTSGFRFELPDDTPDDYAALVRRCWSEAPTDRPDFAAVAADLDAMRKRLKNDAKTVVSAAPQKAQKASVASVADSISIASSVSVEAATPP